MRMKSSMTFIKRNRCIDTYNNIKDGGGLYCRSIALRYKEQEATNVHLSTSLLNGTYAGNDKPAKKLVEDGEYLLVSCQVAFNCIKRL